MKSRTSRKILAFEAEPAILERVNAFVKAEGTTKKEALNRLLAAGLHANETDGADTDEDCTQCGYTPTKTCPNCGNIRNAPKTRIIPKDTTSQHTQVDQGRP